MKKAVLECADPGSAGSELTWPARALLERFATKSRVGSRAFFDPRMVSSWLESWMRLCANSGRDEMASAVMSWMGVTGSTAGISIRSVVDRKSTRLNSSHLGISYAVFCLKDTATTEIYTLSLHDALPIWGATRWRVRSCPGWVSPAPRPAFRYGRW